MPRLRRPRSGGLVCHVLNRSNRGTTLFERQEDYEHFELTLEEAQQRVPMRILSYCIMPNHWHFVLWPRNDEDLPEFVRWLTFTHTQRWHTRHDTIGSGHLYQGRYKMFPVQAHRMSRQQRQSGVIDAGSSLYTLLRYVERNPLRAGLVSLAEQWRWGSLWRRTNSDSGGRILLSDPAYGWPHDWVQWVNRPQTPEEEAALAMCIARGRPFGPPRWVEAAAMRLGLQSTLKSRGRPKKVTREKGSDPLFSPTTKKGGKGV